MLPPLLWIVFRRLICLRHCRHASIRTLAVFAAVPIGVIDAEGCCHLSIDLQGTSRLFPRDPPRPRSHPNPALSHISRIQYPLKFC
jgi:hypothetical protein